MAVIYSDVQEGLENDVIINSEKFDEFLEIFSDAKIIEVNNDPKVGSGSF